MSTDDTPAADPAAEVSTPAKVKKPRKPKPKAKKKPAPKKQAVKVKRKVKPAKSARKTAKPAKKTKKAKRTAKRKKKGPISIKGKLYKLLLARLPKTMRKANGNLDAEKLGKKLKVTSEALYQWLRKNKLMPDKAVALVKASNGKLKLPDLYGYVFK